MDTMERATQALEEAHEELKAIIRHQGEQQAIDEEISKARTSLDKCVSKLTEQSRRSEQTAVSFRKVIEALEKTAQILNDAKLKELHDEMRNMNTRMLEQFERSRIISRRYSWTCTAINLAILVGLTVILYRVLDI